MLKITTATAAVTILIAQTAYACRCTSGMTAQENYDRAAAVAVAEVTSMNGDPESRAGALYELHLSQAWKASLPANLRVLTKTTCAYRMQVGEHHLIYLMPTTAAERAHFETRACMGNSATEKAKLSLNWLSSQREADITN